MTNEGIVAKAEMLIRCPVSKVFEAFVDPAITSKFWFSRGSAKLELGQSVRWDWEMYGFSAEATVKALEPNKRILVEWSAYGAPTDIEWVFTARSNGTTFVSITNSGFGGSPQEIANLAVGSTEGFSFVLAGVAQLLTVDSSTAHDLNPLRIGVAPRRLASVDRQAALETLASSTQEAA